MALKAEVTGPVEIAGFSFAIEFIVCAKEEHDSSLGMVHSNGSELGPLSGGKSSFDFDDGPVSKDEVWEIGPYFSGLAAPARKAASSSYRGGEL